MYWFKAEGWINVHWWLIFDEGLLKPNYPAVLLNNFVFFFFKDVELCIQHSWFILISAKHLQQKLYKPTSRGKFCRIMPQKENCMATGQNIKRRHCSHNGQDVLPTSTCLWQQSCWTVAHTWCYHGYWNEKQKVSPQWHDAYNDII